MSQIQRENDVEQRVGRRIRAYEVRVIDHNGSQRGIMSTNDALELADDVGLQLVEVNSKANPPVCKIMDYGKHKFEASKREREARKNQKVIEVKQVKFRPKTHGHDFETKLRSIQRFLEEGNKVKLIVQFRGRETAHPEVGDAMLTELYKATNSIAIAMWPITSDGTSSSLTLLPRPSSTTGTNSVVQTEENS